MSRTVDVVLIVSVADDSSAEDLAFWLGTPEALDAEAFPVVADATDGGGEAGQVAPVGSVGSVGSVGHLLPLSGALGEELWGGYKALSVSVWGGVTNHMHWGRFLERVTLAGWQDPERLQLLVKDDGDTYFRMYMFRDGSLRNVVPAPGEEGYEHPW